MKLMLTNQHFHFRTLICGDKEAGLSVFWADDGLDTGPVLLQEKCDVLEEDTVDSLYKRFLYPVGVSAVARAVDLVAEGMAPREAQTEKGATYDPMLNKPELQKVFACFSSLRHLQLFSFCFRLTSTNRQVPFTISFVEWTRYQELHVDYNFQAA